MTLRNIKLLIAYDGTGYSGWQRQKKSPSIQGMIEDRLAVMTNGNITIHGAGRTDAGVHAAGMVANFATESAIPCIGLLNGLNSMLPKEIRILQVEEADENFHSRYSATGKTYIYRIFTGTIQLPTERLYTAHYPCQFNDLPVRQALSHILGTHDFSSFEATGSRDTKNQNGRGAVRTIFRAKLIPHPEKNETWHLSLTGDGFLRHMVRNLVGTLMYVGTGRLTADEFNSIMQKRNRVSAGPTAPACGLILEKVHYSPLAS